MRDHGRDQLIGRDEELVVIDRFLIATTRRPAGLVVEGPAGIGKSSLVGAAVEEARNRGIRILSVRPSGAEATWAYQSLTDLLGGAGDILAAVPGPQRRALEVALLRTAAPVAEEAPAQARAISLGTVTALLALARAGPVLLAIDDAPWMDAASAAVLTFAVRRLADAPIGVLVTQRVDEPGPAPFDLAVALPTERLWVAPLTVGALHLLLAARLGLTLPRPTLARLHQVAEGNPFHALEIGRALQRLPALPRPGEPLPIPESIRDLIRAHLATVSEGTRRVLLLAAAAGSPSLDDLRPAVGSVLEAAVEEASDRSLIAVDGGIVRFSHPSLASAVYEDAPPADRRAAHAALAAVAGEPEARGRHLALATVIPDADVAAALEAAAQDAKQRGAAETAAELSRLAVDRTPPDDEPSRQRRRLLLANHLMELPDLPAAMTILADLIATLPAGRSRAEARLLAGTIAWYTEEDPGPIAAAHILRALPDAEDDAELLGRLHYRLAVFHDFDPSAAREHARTAIDVLHGVDAPVIQAAAMFELFATTVALGDPPPLDLLREALDTEGIGRHVDQSTVPGIWWIAIDRPDLARARFEDMLTRSRAAGETSGEADLLTRLAETELYADDWPRALELADEATMAARQEGQPTPDPALRIRALIDAHLGRIAEARLVATDGLARAERAGDRLIAASYLLVLGVAAASEARAAEVEALAERSARHLEALGRVQPLRLDLTPERVEALVTLRRVDDAEIHLDRFVAGARVAPRPWADAAIARGAARLAAARGHLDEAVAATDPATDARSDPWRPFDRARTLLVRGELLRQTRSRRDAGDVLETALAAFEALGAAAWAARARSELDRLGRKRPGSDELTPTERRVAELAASGLRNREVAETLGISAKTVEAHLAQVYAKLAIRSRAELGRAFGGQGGIDDASSGSTR